MPDSGFKFASDCNDKYTAWTNPTNAYADDDSLATQNGGGANYEDYSDFSFGLAGTETIVGIECVVGVKNAEGAGNRLYVDLSWDAGTSWTTPDDYSVVTNTTLQDLTIGGATSLWGRTWSAGDFSNINFMVRFHGGSIAGDWSVDYIKFKIYYTSTVAYSMPSGTGAFTLTGIASTLTKALKMAGALGQFTLTGIAAGLSKGYRIAVNVGQFTLTGIAGTFRKALGIAGAVGTFTLTGVASGLKRALKIAVTVGRFVLTSIDATLRFTGWGYLSKNSASWTNKTKNSSNWVNESKNSSSWANQTKNSASWTNKSKNTTNWANRDK